MSDYCLMDGPELKFFIRVVYPLPVLPTLFPRTFIIIIKGNGNNGKTPHFVLFLLS